MTRLRESSECVISLVFMVMNLEKLARLLFILIGFLEFWLEKKRNLHQEEAFSEIMPAV